MESAKGDFAAYRNSQCPNKIGGKTVTAAAKLPSKGKQLPK